ILIENPVALRDKNVDKHGVREVAEAFLTFLWSEEGQRGFARYGWRPVDPKVAEEVKAQFPSVEDLWKIDYLGGWKRVTEEIYGTQGVYSRVIDELRKSQ
ncbi:MAG TPA: sulfate ABC transporter substrate-binding protein, partial [Blastocatellia bacterium]|nr:sulfate ABC transporter substrate-binding protein [Blastocatellia bacterium]